MFNFATVKKWLYLISMMLFFVANTSAANSDFFGAREVVATKGSTTFFQGAKYSPKVMQQMSKADDIYHAFPKSVDGFATKFGQWSTKVGADGKTYQWLKMPGSYGGKTGTFEYIKDANGIINHRFFNVPKVP